MLVLSRRKGESIVIGGRILVQVEQIGKNRVRLVIDAPKNVSVDRLEVWQCKQEANDMTVDNPRK